MGFCRKPKTTSELRSHCGYETDRGHEEYYVPPVRGSRRNLPTWYDDFMVSANYNKNWKRHRKTQWKPKEEEKVKKHSKFRGHINIRKLTRKTKHTWCKRAYWEHIYNEETGLYDWKKINWRWVWQTNTIYFYEGCSEEEHLYEEVTDKDYMPD